MNSKWLFSLGFILEAVSLAGLVLGSATNEQLAYIFVIHCIASALIALAAWLLLPSQYRLPVRSSFIFLYSITVLIPFIGAVGLVSCILPGLYFPKHREAPIFHTQKDIQLPYVQLENQASLLFNDGGLQDVLNAQTNISKRLNVLLAIRNMNKHEAIPILQMALHDSADDIRLLAYAMLDQYESQINADLEIALAQLEQAIGAHRAELHKRIARNYWELAYLGLAKGAVLAHALEQAQVNVQQALQFNQTPELALLSGRIALKQNRPEFATAAFQQAIALGMDSQHVLPYLAEAAYVSGHYQQIPRLLSQLPEALRTRNPFFELTEYWHANTQRS